jgi:hypothetical protein
MCPAAEKILGSLAEKEPGIVPIAFHVDYFQRLHSRLETAEFFTYPLSQLGER